MNARTPFVKLRRFGHERKPLVELLLALHAPDGQHARELRHERHAGVSVGEQAAGQAFHGDEADVALLAQGDQLKLAVGGKVAERVLQRFVQAAFHALEGNLELVRRHADMGDLALLLGLEHALVHAGAVAGLVALVDAVELVQVDMVGAQKTKRRFQVFPKPLGRAGLGFSGDGDLTAHALECKADALLAVGIRARRVEERHAAFISTTKQTDCRLLGNALNRQGPERILRRDDTGRPQRNGAHA